LKIEDWQQTWNPKKHWKDSPDFLVYRDDVLRRVFELVAECRGNRARAGRLRKNLPFFCERMEMLFSDAGALHLLPEPAGAGIDELANELG
jgi:hypothetical protein